MFAAGGVAGLINVLVGSGTLITFPTLLAVGYPPVLANVTNAVGLVPGSAAGAIGYRRELSGQRDRIVRLGVATTLGSIAGAVLLLALPDRVFEAAVPVLIALALVLVAIQPRVSAWVTARRTEPAPAHGGPVLLAATFAVGVYGGYFGAGFGIVTLALFGLLLDESLHRMNAAKNVLAALVNGVAAIVFVALTSVAWEAAGLIALGSVVGGYVGGHYGRRLPAQALRGLIIAVGVFAIVQLVR